MKTLASGEGRTSGSRCPLQAVFLTGTGADGLTYVNPKTLSAAVRGAFAPTPVHFN